LDYSVQSPSETIKIEHRDRMRRLQRLSRRADLPRPEISTDLTMPAEALSNIQYDVPVVRVRYPGRAFFDVDEARLKPQARRAIEVIADTLKQGIPDSHVVVVGHTDWTASVAYNQGLSERRARNAADYLHRLGVGRNRIDFIGMSERQPVARNDTSEGRALNRRVEFLVSSFEEANFRFVSTRAVVCDYLDPKDFDRESCFQLGERRTTRIDPGDRTGKVNTDPTEAEIRAAERGGAGVGDSKNLTEPIRVSPPEKPEVEAGQKERAAIDDAWQSGQQLDMESEQSPEVDISGEESADIGAQEARQGEVKTESQQTAQVSTEEKVTRRIVLNPPVVREVQLD
jgi:outer membrane protein OmpA-like peptidoglycan-associated protein